MTAEIKPFGGMAEVGKNMTSIKIDDSRVIIDMGMKLEKILSQDNKNLSEMEKEKLINIGGIPDDSELKSKNVSAIILTHGHLDHIGSVSKLAQEYDAPIYATPYTSKLVKSLIKKEETADVDNEINEVELGETSEIGDLEIEFISGVHSIPQNSFPAIHSSKGVFLCVGGFKIDNKSGLEQETDFNSLKKLKNSGEVISLVCSVKADKPQPTPPETRAREMLEQVMSKITGKGKGILVTVFSSHIARIKEIIDIAFKIDRTPVILGRSLRKKCKIASKLNIVKFPIKTKIIGNHSSIKDALKVISKNRDKYVVITSGHQGEPNSILSRIADKEEPYEIKKRDDVIFSASLIPNPLNRANRKLLEAKLESQGASIHRNVHVSGHAGKPGTKKLIKEIGPSQVIPFHGTQKKRKSVIEIGKEVGYSDNQLHKLNNGEKLTLDD